MSRVTNLKINFYCLRIITIGNDNMLFILKVDTKATTILLLFISQDLNIYLQLFQCCVVNIIFIRLNIEKMQYLLNKTGFSSYRFATDTARAQAYSPFAQVHSFLLFSILMILKTKEAGCFLIECVFLAGKQNMYWQLLM